MYKENIFLKIITYAPLVFIPLLVAIVLFVSIETYKNSLKENIKRTEDNLYKLEIEALENKVKSISNLIVYKKSIVKERLKLTVKDRVEQAYLIAKNIYDLNKNIRTELEIKNMIKDALSPLLWNDGESFIWIVDYDGIFELQPEYLKHLEGTSIINIQDINARYVIQEEIAICREKGEGFLWDTFTKANDKTKKQYKQVAFVKAFGHYKWYFGSAQYLDTATKKTDKIILDTIKYIDSANSLFIFIMTKRGDILVNKSIPDAVGKNIDDIDNKAIKDIFDKIEDAIKDKESISYAYQWLNPATNKIEEKYSYIQLVPNTDWIVGSGFYLSSVKNKISRETVDMYELFYKKSKNIIYIAIVIILFFLLLSYYISMKLKRSFRDYEVHINNKNFQLYELNTTLETKVKDRTSELEKIKNELETLATTDALTTMHNRYSLMKVFANEINRSKRYSTPLSVIMYDIDFFKKVNDRYGHDIGDNVLKQLSYLVKKSLRDTDSIGRYGGEEFLILLPNTTIDDAKSYADRLRKEIEEYSFATVGNITISLGLIELKTDENLDDVFKRVDILLYKSKNGGRNRVSF